jgi:hypothetical protein
VSWQEVVHFEARRAWGNRPLWFGPVGVSFWFYLREPRSEQNLPDLTNLAKAAEDALQGAIIHNDRRVRATHAEMLFLPRGRPERTWIEVWAYPNAGRIEPEEPGPYGYRPWDWGLQSATA